MTRHVSVAALARFREGDLGQRRAARVSAHLSSCARCTDLSAELAGITMLLASTPAPAMPERLASRIQDTLAAEAARRVTPDPGTEPGRRDLPSRAGAPRWRPRLSSPVAVRALAAAGAIAVVAGGGYLLSQNSPSTTSGTSSRAAPLVRPGASGQHFGVSQQGGRMQTTGLPITFRDGRASVVAVASGINYRPATLAQQVTTALSAVPSAHAQVPLHPAPTAVSSPGSGTSAGPAATKFGTMTVGELRGCVGRIAPRGRVLLVDVARYQGRQATVIVVAPHGAARQVWVVGPACSASRGDVLAHLSMPGG